MIKCDHEGGMKMEELIINGKDAKVNIKVRCWCEKPKELVLETAQTLDFQSKDTRQAICFDCCMIAQVVVAQLDEDELENFEGYGEWKKVAQK